MFVLSGLSFLLNEKVKLFDRGEEATYNAFRNHCVVSLMHLSYVGVSEIVATE